MHNDASRRARREPPCADVTAKWLTWAEYLTVRAAALVHRSCTAGAGSAVKRTGPAALQRLRPGPKP